MVRVSITLTREDFHLARAWVKQRKRWKDVPAAVRDGLWQLIARNPLSATQLQAAVQEYGIDPIVACAVLRGASGGRNGGSVDDVEPG